MKTPEEIARQLWDSTQAGGYLDIAHAEDIISAAQREAAEWMREEIETIAIDLEAGNSIIRAIRSIKLPGEAASPQNQKAAR